MPTSCDYHWTLTGPAHPSGDPYGAHRAGNLVTNDKYNRDNSSQLNECNHHSQLLFCYGEKFELVQSSIAGCMEMHSLLSCFAQAQNYLLRGFSSLAPLVYPGREKKEF